MIITWINTMMGKGGTPPSPPDKPLLVFNETLQEYRVSNASSYPSSTSWSWASESGIIAGQSSTSLSISAAPAGEYVRVFADSVGSDWVIGEASPPAITDSFVAPDETPIVGYTENGATWGGINGTGAAWNDGSGQIIDDQLKMVISPTSTTGMFTRNNVPTGNKKITLKGYSDKTQSNLSTRKNRNFRFDRSAINTYISINTGTGSTFILQDVVNGVNISGWTISAPTLPTSDDFSVSRIGNIVRLYVDGVEIPASVAAGGYPVTAPPAPVIAYSPAYPLGSPILPVRLLDDLIIEELPDYSFTISTITTTLPSPEYPDGSIALSGEATGGATTVEISFADGDGVMVTDWSVEVPVTAGTWTFTTNIPPEISGTDDSQVAIRNSADVEEFAILSLGVVPAYEPIWDDNEFGLNIGHMNYFAYADIVHDRGYVTQWRYWAPGGVLTEIPAEDKDENGAPTKLPPAPSTRYIAIIFGPARVGVRTGPWKVTTNADSISWASGVNVNRVQNSSTEMTLTAVDPSLDYLTTLYVDATSIPAGGFKINVLPVGDLPDPTRVVTDDLVDLYNATNLGGSGWQRDMKNSGAESGTGANANIAGRSEFAIDMRNRAGLDWYHNVPYQICVDDLPSVVAEAEAYLAGTPSNSRVQMSVGNEAFNERTYVAQWWQIATGGVTHGFCDGVTLPTGVVCQNGTTFFGGNGSVASSTSSSLGYVVGQCLRQIEVGEWLAVKPSNGGHAVIECIQTAPAGTIVAQTSTTYFTVHATYDAIAKAMRREHVYQQKRLGQALKAIDPVRCISTYEMFLHDIAANAVDYLLFEDAYKFIDYASPSWYAGQRTTYSSLPWASLYASDYPAFKEGYYTWAYEEIDDCIAVLRNLKHGIRTGLRRAGIPNEDCPKLGMFYEGGFHNTFGAVPEADRAGLVAAITQMLKESEEYDCLTYFHEQMAEHIGGTRMYFADVSRPYFNGGSTDQVQFFDVRGYQFDGAYNNYGADEQRWLATLDYFG